MSLGLPVLEDIAGHLHRGRFRVLRHPASRSIPVPDLGTLIPELDSPAVWHFNKLHKGTGTVGFSLLLYYLPTVSFCFSIFLCLAASWTGVDEKKNPH
jgi:hypothetical protein